MTHAELITVASETLIPIREISRVTGINTVTLRAWERRYGLLKPQRTKKGHRLYSPTDIERVKNIQSWLVRGLSISKVSALLTQPELSPPPIATENIWKKNSEILSQVLQQLNRRKLESLFDEWFKLYPPEIVADECLGPALEQLTLPGYSNTSRRAFLLQILREYLYSILYRQRQMMSGEPVLIIQLNDQQVEAIPLMLSYSLATRERASELLTGIPMEECLPLAVQLNALAVVIYADTTYQLDELRQLLLHGVFPCPVWVAGKSSILLADEKRLQSTLLGEKLTTVLESLMSPFSYPEISV